MTLLLLNSANLGGLADLGTSGGRNQLLDLTVGRDADPFDRSIDNQVSRLRKKIEADPKVPALIKTHWGGGYSLVAEIGQP